MESNLAVYGCHLPLDCHPEIGNNRLLADKLGLSPEATFLPYEEVDIGLIAACSYNIGELKDQFVRSFPQRLSFHGIRFGKPKNIAILTGSGQSGSINSLPPGPTPSSLENSSNTTSIWLKNWASIFIPADITPPKLLQSTPSPKKSPRLSICPTNS